MWKLAILSVLGIGSSFPVMHTSMAQEAESEKITVQTDKESYPESDYPYPLIVIISGTVSRDILSEGENVVIQVLHPMDTRYRVDFVNVTALDGSF